MSWADLTQALWLLVRLELKPRLGAWRRWQAGEWARACAGLLVAFVFLALVYGLLRPTFGFLARQEGLGPLLIARLSQVLFLVFFSMQALSQLITSLSALFLDRGLELLLATPLAPRRLFLARFMRSWAASAWMVALLWVPVALAMQRALGGGAAFVLWALACLVGLSFWGAGLSTLVLLASLRLVAPGRLRRAMTLVFALMACALVLVVRAMQPEKLTNAGNTMAAAEWLRQFRLPQPGWLPSAMAANALDGFHNDPAAGLGWMALLWLGGLALLLAVALWGGRAYLPLWLRTRDAGGGKEPARGGPWEGLLGRLWARPRGWVASLCLQEAARTLRRDTQRLQFLFLGTLVGIFLFNLARLPMQDPEVASLHDPLFIASAGLSCLVLLAVAARFAFPAQSLEGEASWLLRTAPISSARYLAWRWLGTLALLSGLGLLLFGSCVLALKPSPRLLLAGLLVMLTAPMAITSLCVGLGAAWGRPDMENPEDMVTGGSGLLLLTLAGLYLLLSLGLLVPPLGELSRLAISHRFTPRWAALLLPAACWLLLQATAVALPMRYGHQALARGQGA
jgi:ABC-2 type transport system permease protein